LSVANLSKSRLTFESAVRFSRCPADRDCFGRFQRRWQINILRELSGGAGLRFVNADALASALEVTAYEAAEIGAALRRALVKQRESFVLETVLSDPVGEKVNALASYAALGYTVVLIFIRIDSAEESIRRVAMRVSQGGHDVPDEKLHARFERTQANLKRAILCLPHVIIYNNSDLSHPYQLADVYENGQRVIK
jgi:predicted ABC-type ATPase